MLSTNSFLVALTSLPIILAQTYTSCDPTNTTCSPDVGLASWSHNTDFTQGKGADWTLADGTTLTYGNNGAEFTINKDGQAPTIGTDFAIFFGKLEVVMQAAPGKGIVSSIVLESADLDEVDWEFVGSDTSHAQSNYFGKGNTTTYDRVQYLGVSGDVTTSFHTYTFDWTAERIIFSIDGVAMRTLAYADANGGKNFPQTPSKVKLGSWTGGGAAQPSGTVEWAGGSIDFDDAPFTMYIKSVKITNYNPGKSYEWSDKTGSYDSIKVVNGTSIASATQASATNTSTKSSPKIVALGNSTVSSATLATATAAKQTTTSGTSAAKSSSTATATAVSTGDAATISRAAGLLCLLTLAACRLAL